MVDSQFADDRYVDNEGRNREAIAEANKRAAERNALSPKPKTRAESISARAAAIQQAAKNATDEDRIVLTELSKFAPGGEQISVAVKRLAPQELLAGDLLPSSARKMVNYLVEMGEKAVASEKARVGIAPTTSKDFIREAFDGDNIEANDAYTGMVNAICIACVKDPDIRLYWNEKAKGDDPNGLVITLLPFADREKISYWALGAEEVAASTVEPFLQQSKDDAHHVSPVERWNGKAERADQV